jgi:hypothetical protein
LFVLFELRSPEPNFLEFFNGRHRQLFLAFTHHPKHIPHYKFGSHVLYIKEELDDIIRRNRQEGES